MRGSCNRSLVARRLLYHRSRRAVRSRPIDPDRSGNILELPAADIVEDDVELVAHFLLNAAGHAYAAWVGERLQARRYVDALAPHVAAVDDHVPDIYADAKFEPLVDRNVRIALRHPTLQHDGTAHSVHDACELRQNPVAGDSDDASLVSVYGGLDELIPVRPPLFERAFFIGPDEATVASDVRRHDGCQPSLDMDARGVPRVFSLAQLNPPRGLQLLSFH